MNFPNAEQQLTEFFFEEKAKANVASPLLLQAHDL